MTELIEGDVRLETYRDASANPEYVVRARHLPTKLEATSKGHRSLLKATEEAIESLRAKVDAHCEAKAPEISEKAAGAIVDLMTADAEARGFVPERAVPRDEGDQPLPTTNDLPAIQDVVIREIEERKQVGIRRYGTPLQPHNGRDALLDLYQELLDAVMYARQLLWERDGK